MKHAPKAGLKNAAKIMQGHGRNGDSVLAHINPGEAAHLKRMGGAGTRNPKTGLLEFGGYEGEGTGISDGPGPRGDAANDAAQFGSTGAYDAGTGGYTAGADNDAAQFGSTGAYDAGTGGYTAGVDFGAPAQQDTDQALLDFDVARHAEMAKGFADRANSAMPTGVMSAGLFALNKALGGKLGDAYGNLRATMALGHDKEGTFGSRTSSGGDNNVSDGGGGGDGDRGSNPYGSVAPTQTTAITPSQAGSGERQYVWDPVARQYTLTNLGGGGNPMGYTQGQVFRMAAGGRVHSGIGSAMGPRFVQGGGTGLSDGVPVAMDDGQEGRLADGEFVIPADAVAGLGGGSSAAGARELYAMMERIRMQAHGSKEQIKPVNPQQALPA